MKAKILIGMLIGATLAAAVLYWVEYPAFLALNEKIENPHPQNMAVGESVRKSYFDKDFSALLPDWALLAAGADSPSKLLDQLEISRYPGLAASIRAKGEKLGFDITDKSACRQRGINTEKPFGLAVLEMQSTRFSTNPVVVVFVGVADKRKFSALLEERFATAKLRLVKKSIEDIPCTLVKKGGKTAGVYCYKSGYWMFYIDATRVAVEEKFKKRMLLPGKRLSASRNFQQCIQKIDKGQAFFYVDARRAISTIKDHNYSVGDLVEKFSPRQMRGLAGAFCANGSILKISAYLNASKETVDDWKNPGSSANILARFPTNPLFCATCNLNIAKKWQGTRKSIDQVLPSVIQSLQPHMTPGAQPMPTTIGEVLQKLESTIEEKLKERIDIEKTLVPKLQGNVVLAVYQIDWQNSTKFDAVLAIRLKSGKKIKEIISKLAGSMEDENNPALQIKTAKSTFYTFRLQDFALTAGVLDEWLVLCTKCETCRKILDKPGDMTAGLKDRDIADAMNNGNPIALYLNLKRLGYSEHFREFTWRVWLGERGIHTRLAFQCDQNALDFLLNGLEKMPKSANFTPPFQLPKEE